MIAIQRFGQCLDSVALGTVTDHYQADGWSRLLLSQVPERCHQVGMPLLTRESPCRENYPLFVRNAKRSSESKGDSWVTIGIGAGSVVYHPQTTGAPANPR